jgi:hypothetical protein
MVLTAYAPELRLGHHLHLCNHSSSQTPKQLGRWVHSPTNTSCYRWKRVLRRRKPGEPSGRSTSPLLRGTAKMSIPPAWGTDETNLLLLLEHYEIKNKCTSGEYTAHALRELKATMAFAFLYVSLSPLKEGARGLTMLQRKGTAVRNEWTGLLTDAEAEAFLQEMRRSQLRQDQVNHFFRTLELKLERSNARRQASIRRSATA